MTARAPSLSPVGLALLAGLGAGGCEPAPAVSGAGAADPAVLHRLTEDQVNLALRDLFDEGALPRVDLPPDVAVDGFDNNALTRGATPYLVESLQRDLAAVVAAEVADGGAWLACAPDGGAAPRTCGHDTLLQTQQRAWRRPATPDEQDWLLGLFDGWYDQAGFAAALQLSLLVVLQSPDFLYLVERGDPALAQGEARGLTPWELASRMSFFLWDTMPDEALFAAAHAGALDTAPGVRLEVRRMLADDRARAASLRFYRQWLGADRVQDMDPDPSWFPDATGEDAVGGRVADLKAAFLAEFDLFVAHAAWERGTLDALLTSRTGFVSPLTAPLYGVAYDPSVDPVATVITPSGQAGEFFEVALQEVALPPEQRAGALTRGAFLAAHSFALQPRPVSRGVFLRQRLLCLDPVAPPEGVPSLDDPTTTTWTTNRERYAAHTADPACAGCHTAIDGVGFAFEHYDALGGWRTTDNGAPVDASGALHETDVDGPVDDAVELLEVLAASRQTYDCAVTQVMRYGLHHSTPDPDAQAALQGRFWATGGDLPRLLEDFVASPAFRTIRSPAGEEAP